jgi:long-chain acyl-CoA synthetase
VKSDGSCRTVLFDDIPHLIAAPAESGNFINAFLADDTALTAAVAGELAAVRADTTCGITRDDLATIIYTSGSTGEPKGVMLTHGAFAAGCEGMLAHGFDIRQDRDVYLSYLPLAHVYERACGIMLCLWTGVPAAFCGIEEVRDVLKQVRPTLLHGVPAVWRKVKDNIFAHATGFKDKMLNWALAQKQPGFKRFLADKLVFRKIRGELGGRLRICTSGGAPISPEIVEFYQQIGIQLLQGYGLTETTGASVVNRPSGCADGACNKIGSVGTLINEAGLEMRIAPLPGQEDSGEGEIQFRGPTVMSGYWNRPADSSKTFTDDGWFKTGDRGRVDEHGFLFITGRIKRLLKTDGGKYVAPEKIEKAFEGSPLVAYVVPVGDGKPFISGLVFLNMQLASEIFNKTGSAVITVPLTPAVLAQNAEVIAAVQNAVNQANAKLERWEQLKKFSIVPVEATVADGLLTPTLKIRTEEVLKRYADMVEALYRKPRTS